MTSQINMKNTRLAVLMVLFLYLPTKVMANSCDQYLNNNASEFTLNAVHYDKLTPRVFRDAIERDLKKAQSNLSAIKHLKDAPTFQNTIEAIEFMDQDLGHSWQVFENYVELMNTKSVSDRYERIHKKFSPQVSALGNKVFFDTEIFKKVEVVYNQRHALSLTPIQLRLTEKTYEAFIKNGVNLSPDKKARLTVIGAKLSSIANAFNINSLKEVDAFQLVITDANELNGLPKNTLAAMRTAAEAKGLKNSWLVTLKPGIYLSIMNYAENRELRKKLWTARSSRNTSGKYDNSLHLLEIVRLRNEQAQILGFKNYADMAIEQKMAKKIETVHHFLDRLAVVYKKQAKKDLAEVEAFAGHAIAPWDMKFYSLKLEEKKYSYDQEELRAYFSIDKVLAGAFYTANKLYGIEFIPRSELPTWHKDVRAFEVRDRDGKLLSLFYFDPYPREGKSNGAYCTYLRATGFYNRQILRPHVLNMGNFSPPVGDQPALLTINDALTVYHELGHGLHQMLTTVPYTSLAGTKVMRDGVELPSQLNERWLLEAEVLNKFAKHYQTGEKIPQELLEKVLASQKFQAGINGLTQVQLGKLDLAWYTEDISQLKTAADVKDFESKAVENYRLLSGYDSVFSTSFDHIFAGGYAVGYYGYKWAEVLAADAFELFKKHGVFNPEIAAHYAATILTQGGAEDFDVLYRKFRGQDPDPDALLRSEGLIP